jgi:hypothetical protein
VRVRALAAAAGAGPPFPGSRRRPRDADSTVVDPHQRPCRPRSTADPAGHGAIFAPPRIVRLGRTDHRHRRARLAHLRLHRRRQQGLLQPSDHRRFRARNRRARQLPADRGTAPRPDGPTATVSVAANRHQPLDRAHHDAGLLRDGLPPEPVLPGTARLLGSRHRTAVPAQQHRERTEACLQLLMCLRPDDGSGDDRVGEQPRRALRVPGGAPSSRQSPS